MIREPSLLSTKKEVETVSIEVWSDFLCPWCFIGESTLVSALEEVGIPYRLTFHAFQMNPTQIGSETIFQVAAKGGMDYSAAKDRANFIESRATDAGLGIHMNQVIMVNTFDSHRLSFFAKQHGKGQRTAEELFRAAFILGRDISMHAELEAIALRIGLDGKDVREMFESNLFISEVAEELQSAKRSGVQSVPHFVVNGSHVLRGAHSKATMVRFVNSLQ